MVDDDKLKELKARIQTAKITNTPPPKKNKESTPKVEIEKNKR